MPPPKPLIVDKNRKYGPPLVTDKYRPLGAITFTSQSEEYFGSLMTNRVEMLKSLGLLPQELHLSVPYWDDIAKSEVKKKPPLVVISSNRSTWIQAGIESANARLPYLDEDKFENISDLRAIDIPQGMERTPPNMSPPIYCPKRIGDAGPRNIYIVVHASEYNFYRQQLLPYGITIVGWAFRRPRRRGEWLTGFGPSRFAAIEFCKKLRIRATVAGTAPWNYAWLIDDNVVALTGFPGFDAIEREMTADHVCAGFEGGTANKTYAQNQEWAHDEIEAERGKQSAVVPIDQEKGIVQQAALWNIDYLTKKNLNFGPIYLESAEDMSFGFYLDGAAAKYRYYGSVSIRKEEVTFYDIPGCKSLQKERKRLIKLIADRENTKVFKGTVPPPIIIKPKETEDGEHEMTLGSFVVNRVLPKADKVKWDLLETKKVEVAEGLKNTARCQAVEQITSLAMKQKFVLPKTAMDNAFSSKGQAVKTVSTRRRRS